MLNSVLFFSVKLKKHYIIIFCSLSCDGGLLYAYVNGYAYIHSCDIYYIILFVGGLRRT